MYKNARYRSQFWTDFHEIHVVGAGSLMGQSYCFWKQPANRITDMGENLSPKNNFSSFMSDGMDFFWGKNLKTVFGTPFLKKKKKKKGCIHFCRPTPHSVKNGHKP